MKKVMVGMTVLMGFSMSLILSLVGTLSGGHFSVPGWLISFGISFIISLVIGFVIPVKKCGDSVCKICHADPRSFMGNLISSIVSDLIYTPILTIIMVVIMVSNAAKHAPAGAVPPISAVLPGSLALTLLVGLLAIMVLQPLFLKMLTKNMPSR